jgi:hypothetical protein
VRWLLIFIAACSSAHADSPTDFAVIYAAFESPRCRNCHPAGDAPLQFDDGRPHSQNITRLSIANGLPCATCHRDKNNERSHQPPGAPKWNLPPAATPMVFEGRTQKQLCEQLQDPKQTGNRDLAAIVDHVATDPLVGWGWDPGPGRTPVPIARSRLVAAMRAWVAAGAPCPAE